MPKEWKEERKNEIRSDKKANESLCNKCAAKEKSNLNFVLFPSFLLQLRLSVVVRPFVRLWAIQQFIQWER